MWSTPIAPRLARSIGAAHALQDGAVLFGGVPTPNRSCGSLDERHCTSSLTARQREIVMLAANGLSNKEIARRLGLSEGTVKLHLHNVYTRLGIRNRTVLVGLVHTPTPA